MGFKPSGPGRRPLSLVRAAVQPVRDMLGWMRPAEPLELQIVGRTVLHAAVVGLGAGVLGVLFFAGTELVQALMLERLAGYEPLRAKGEGIATLEPGAIRLWLVALIPALGGLIAGLVCWYAPECAGGGGDAAITAFHQHDGVVRRRVLWVKPIASIATLGTGGSGGREGPTMQLGAALGSTVGRYLRVSPRERRVLMVAGIAAGISAVFRTPLGAALIAIEMLYRDDFEAEALIPAVLASVIAYSVSITVFGQATLFGYLAPHAFRPAHIPLYIGLALVISLVAMGFVASLRLGRRVFARPGVPAWLRPALGGLALGVFAVLAIHFIGPLLGRGERSLGILGGGYGAAQAAITGAPWLPGGWLGVQILLLLALTKVFATSLTVGSGGSAGDFAPSLAIGGLVGGAFGLAAQLLLDDPTIQPGAFALVGMGTFYGGIANTPLAALVLVCEMAGSYDLLVPLMLAEGVAFIALRRVTLYHAQVPTLHDSPAHRQDFDPLRRLACRDVVDLRRPFVVLAPAMSVVALTRVIDEAADQDVFPVVDGAGLLRGVIAADALRVVLAHPELNATAVAADLMSAPVTIGLDDDLRTIASLMVERDLRTIPVVDAAGGVIALLDEHDLSAAMVAGLARPRAT